MDHGQACFSLRLLKHEAAVWMITYDSHGQLLGESVHAADTVYGSTQLVVAVAALWTLRGFNRASIPTDIGKQTRLIAKGAHIAARNGRRVYYK